MNGLRWLLASRRRRDFHCIIKSLTAGMKDNTKIDDKMDTMILGVELDGS